MSEDNCLTGCDTFANYLLLGPISGSLSAFPGLNHKVRAMFALTMCARWGTDLGPTDRTLHNGLRKLVGPGLSFICDYIGTTARVLATVVPFVQDDSLEGDKDQRQITFIWARWDNTLGKHGNKQGIWLHMNIHELAKKGIDVDGLLGLYEKVGKGIDGLGWKVQVSLV
jgi:retrograde regulation protein 2